MRTMNHPIAYQWNHIEIPFAELSIDAGIEKKRGISTEGYESRQTSRNIADLSRRLSRAPKSCDYNGGINQATTENHFDFYSRRSIP
jgi:hypothetical protein